MDSFSENQHSSIIMVAVILVKVKSKYLNGIAELYGKELSRPVKFWEVLQWLHIWQFLEKASAP
jgi:hypothetical protein